MVREYLQHFGWWGLAGMVEILSFCRMRLASVCGYGCSLTSADVSGFSDLVVHSPEGIYRIRFAHRLGPSDVRCIFNENQENVMSTVLQFAGPGNSFYGIPTTPGMLGFDYLTVEFRSGNTRAFKKKERLFLEDQT